MIEYNAGLRPPLSLTVPYQPNRAGDGTNFFGASLEALVRLGRAKGYRIVGCNISGSNAFFVRDGSVRRPLRRAGDGRGALRAAASFLLVPVRRAASAEARSLCDRVRRAQGAFARADPRLVKVDGARAYPAAAGEVAEWLKAAVC